MTATTAVCSSSFLDRNTKINFMVQERTICARRSKNYAAIKSVQASCKVENPESIGEIAGLRPGTSLQPSQVVRSGNPSARHRRLAITRQTSSLQITAEERKMYSVPNKWGQSACVETHGLQHCQPEYMMDILNQKLLSHEHVIYLSKKIRVGVMLENCKKRLQEKIGYRPSYIQWAAYMNLSPKELNTRLFESSRAIDKLVMANTPLVISVARRYKNMGIDITELTQEGLNGLVRGLKKFDYTKGVKLSTYVHWWIRQAIVTFLVKHSRIIQLPAYLHHLLSSIKNIKTLLKNEGVTPSIERIAMALNISNAKVKNAIKAQKSIISFERQTYTNINYDPCGTTQNCVMDSSLENQPWLIEGNVILKEDVNNLINSTLTKREKEILRLYFGFDACGYTWEAIGKRFGLSRETVRKVGLKAIQKVKHSAIYHNLDLFSIQYLK